ncbi:MAG: hypothetical protein Q8S32_11825 [Burkholderiaceae bacterium]|nr:hypothetical protein [Burkholderiaceae bacterium]
MTIEDDGQGPALVQTPRLWQGDGWTAKVVKSEEDDGWAVEMRLDGESEPALVAPWTMGRDKKNPKPLDPAAFYTWVKTANEVVRRHEQQLHARLHQRVWVSGDDGRYEVCLDIDPDEDSPTATLTAFDSCAEEVARVPVSPGFKLTPDSASRWVSSGWVNPMPPQD